MNNESNFIGGTVYERQQKPNLFIVGNPKSSTTSLNLILAKHPDIYVPKIKEPYIFFAKIIKELFRDRPDSYEMYHMKMPEYLDLYREVEKETYLVDGSTFHLFDVESAKEIFKFNPEAKIIIIFREPLQFLRSLHSELLFLLAQRENNFDRAFENNEFIGNRPSAFNYLEWVKYKGQIKRFAEVFPKTNIKVLIYKNMKNDYKRSVGQILDFLQIDKALDFDVPVKNQNRHLRFPFIRKIALKPLVLKTYFKIFNEEQHAKIFKVYSKIIKKEMPRIKFSREKQIKYKRIFYNDVQEINKYLKENEFIEPDVDLVKLWGYDAIY